MTTFPTFVRDLEINVALALCAALVAALSAVVQVGAVLIGSPS